METSPITDGLYKRVLDQLPPGGLFADQHWRIAVEPFALGPELFKTLESLGRVLLQFYKASNLLHRHSLSGKLPEWISHWLNLGKSSQILDWQAHPATRR